MPLFDSYIIVDWSASNTRHPADPVPDAPWTGELTPGEQLAGETYHRTRQAAVDHVRERLLHHTQLNRRILVGFDFPYGYPRGLSLSLGLPDGNARWWNVWAELSVRLQDGDDNVNNRFQVASDLNCIISNGGQGPFWGCPQAQGTPHLAVNGPGFPFQAANGLQLERLRACERRLRVQEAWGLYGPGRVGGQAITGIPRIAYLGRHARLARCSRVWPFETYFSPTPSQEHGPFVLHAEIWPGVVDPEVKQIVAADPAIVRDQAQVRAMCQWAAQLDQNDQLGALFNTPTNVDSSTIKSCLEEEGWILGAH